ncbi:MAG TPA: phytanoyl-CoA dioxygenase family protein [Pyrinomonadaceae bacterium]|nr:phytanoyl-CoA dioxygenase family protein [Pyrinomonadaceae bacterium]
MSVRTEPLTSDEIRCFRETGYLVPIRVLSDETIAELREALDDHLTGRIASETYELTDPIRVKRVVEPDGQKSFEYDYGKLSQPHTFPFLFNLWKRDERFKKVATDPVIAGMARQLLDAKGVIMMEDNVVIKMPQSKTLPWHQDFAYWPIATPSAVTVWIALDRITAENGAMLVAPGSHESGERLPVGFGDARSFMKDDRPGVSEVSQDPAAEGYDVVAYDLQPGDCGFHDAMLWHASGPNTSEHTRRAFILRYIADGTIWLGKKRFPYDPVDCEVGKPIGGRDFPTVKTAF